MRRLLITCSCGERLQVPRSAIGKTGLCPACGRTLAITPSNTSSDTDFKPRPAIEGTAGWWAPRTQTPQEARREFAQAVDLYFMGRYAEALVLLTGLSERFPGNPDIESGRNLCMQRLQSNARVAIEDKSRKALPEPPHVRIQEPAELTDTVVKQFLLEKMFHSPSEEVQLKAAVLASRILGLLGEEAETNPAHAQPEASAAPGPAPRTASAAQEVDTEATLDTHPPEWPSFLEM